MSTQQVETATVVGSITGNGNASVTVTSARISTNPTTVSVAVTTADNTAALVAEKCRNAIALNSVVSNIFQVSGSGADIVLTERVAHANDTTLNIAIANGTCTGLTAAPTSANTTAGDGLTNGYITLAELKADHQLGITATTWDDPLTQLIDSVSRAIDDLCARRFYTTNSDETRYFTPTDRQNLWVGDLVSVTTLATDGNYDRAYSTTWATTDYDLWPYNASLDGIPYSRIDIAPDGDYTFAKSNKFVKVVGKWGWSSTPKPIHEACLLWCMRAWQRQQTPLGISGTTALGNMVMKVPPPDPDVLQMLDPYRLVLEGVL